jgi:Flp pilus assembly protein TadB
MTRATLSSRRARSRLAIWMISLGSALFVLALTLLLQWFIFTDWTHRHDQLHIGAVFAAVVTWFFVLRSQQAARRRQLELLQQLETIRWMNDRIRNALQSIDLLAFAHSEAAEQVRGSVDTIAAILHEVLQTTGISHTPAASAARRKTVGAVALSEEGDSSLFQKSARN